MVEQIDSVSSFELTRKTGQAIDQALHAGVLAVTRHNLLCGFLITEVEGFELPGMDTVSATYLADNLSTILDNLRAGVTAYTVTRHNRPVIYLLPAGFREALDVEL